MTNPIPCAIMIIVNEREVVQMDYRVIAYNDLNEQYAKNTNNRVYALKIFEALIDKANLDSKYETVIELYYKNKKIKTKKVNNKG